MDIKSMFFKEAYPKKPGSSKKETEIYISWDAAPMSWYQFLRVALWILFVLGTIGGLVRVFYIVIALIGAKNVILFAISIYDFIFWAFLMIALFLSASGLRDKKWSGVIWLYVYMATAAIIGQINRIIESSMYEYVGMDNHGIEIGSTGRIVGTFLGVVLIFIPNWIYFKKRRLLFYPSPTNWNFYSTPTSEEDPAVILAEKSALETHEDPAETQSDEETQNENKKALSTVVKKESHTNWKKVCICSMCAVAIVSLSLFVGYNLGYSTGERDANEIADEKIQNLWSRISGLNNDVFILRGELDGVKEDLDWWNECAVVVTSEGEKYHRHSCFYTRGRTFWIYNVEAAISRGYEPCKVCYPPTRD